MEKRPYLSVVIPCYNEEKNLQAGVLGQVEKFLQSKTYDWEVLIVDDGSKDTSRTIIKNFLKAKPHFLLLENSHHGKAFTVLTGLKKAKGQFILFMDLDQATPISEIDKMLPFTADFDIIVGSRKEQRKGAPLFRILMARGFMVLRDLILGLGGVSDTQCGFKLFKNEVAKRLPPKLKIYGENKSVGQKTKGSRISAGFDVELLFVAKKLGYKIKEVGVKWQYVDTKRISPLSDSLEGLLDLLRLKINDLKGFYR